MEDRTYAPFETEAFFILSISHEFTICLNFSCKINISARIPVVESRIFSEIFIIRVVSREGIENHDIILVSDATIDKS
jgi:hypothetical protein